MLKPTGFWSYSRLDDENSQGRLSQLRERVAAQLQLLIGRERVSIFQDRASISFGGAWESQIGESLKDVSFFIPILTTAFLQSDWCRREVVQFRRWEAARGRVDMIFPIQYVDIDESAIGRSTKSFELLNFLRSRQWVDFRYLRFKPYDCEESALKIHKLAEAIRDSLHKTGTQIPSTMTDMTSLVEFPLTFGDSDPAKARKTAVQSSAHEAPALSPDFLDKVRSILLECVGPSSKELVAKKSQLVTSPKELADLLEERLSSLRSLEEGERMELMSCIRALAKQYEPGRRR